MNISTWGTARGGSVPNATARRASMRSLLSDLPQLLDRVDLRRCASQFRLSFGQLDSTGAIAQRFFSALFRLQGGGFVDVLGAQSGVGEHRDQMRLDFDRATGNVEELFFAAGSLHAHFAGTE